MAQMVVVGSANVDLVIRTPHLPSPGETVLGGEFITAMGGKGANQAVGAARLGAQVTFVARVGDDAFGQQCLTAYQKERIDTQYIGITANTATGIALIAVAADGENTILVASGANMALTPDDVAAAEPAFQGADVLVLQLEVPLETSIAAAVLAHKHDLRVVLNPAPAQQIPAELLAEVDVITPNRIELAQMMHLSPEAVRVMSDDDLARTALRLGPPAAVVTLGAAGALAADPGGWTRVPAFKVDAIDTTAAGDSFTAGLAVALARGETTLASAVRYASACGALTATKLGAQPSLPTAKEVEALLRAHSE